MKTIDNWFDEYGESHQNKINKLIHWICIPLIFWSIIALLSLIPNSYLDIFNNSMLNELMHWGTVIIILGLLFYLRLSFKIFVGMVVFSLCVLFDIYYTLHLFESSKFSESNLDNNDFLLYLALIVFVFSWILQFVGHKIEGKKPSFFKDVQFLLIGPAWLLGFIYKKLKIKY
tara:strand:+ start:1217 stop:1735 length:519 start_codon:yes stop_codon:yes gene_type:complete